MTIRLSYAQAATFARTFWSRFGKTLSIRNDLRDLTGSPNRRMEKAPKPGEVLAGAKSVVKVDARLTARGST